MQEIFLKNNTTRTCIALKSLGTRAQTYIKTESLIIFKIPGHAGVIISMMGHRVVNRGRPWRYSVIPSTPDFPTEYQIRRNSNPAGLPVFAAIWGPDFRASIIILTNMFKQVKQIRITLMTMFKVYPSPANALRASASGYFAFVNLTKECKISLVKYQMA